MKKKAITFSFGLVVLLLVMHSCKKEEVPSVTTSAITNITGTTAISGGTITDEGTEEVLERGVCWSTGEPSILDSKTSDGIGPGSFTSNLSNLNPATQYYVRAYATNSVGTGYGMAILFTTVGEVPSVTTLAATDITSMSAKLNGRVNANHLPSTVTFEYGTTTASGQTANPVSGTVTGNSDVDVSVDIADLEPGTTYHFRVKADNSLGSVYGDNETFTTLFLVPTEGLVAYFPFNGNANDETVNGNHGTVSGALLTSDRFGNPNSAYSFDGINDNITGNTNNWPFARLSRTISLWANISAIPNNANKLFLEYGIGDEHTYQSIYFQNTETYGKRVVYGAMYDDVNTPFNYSINTWYNVIGTYDGTTAKIYINGDFIDGGNKTTWNTLIGDYFFGGSWTGFFFGLLDDIRIYNRVLSQEEILQLYNEIP